MSVELEERDVRLLQLVKDLEESGELHAYLTKENDSLHHLAIGHNLRKMTALLLELDDGHTHTFINANGTLLHAAILANDTGTAELTRKKLDIAIDATNPRNGLTSLAMALDPRSAVTIETIKWLIANNAEITMRMILSMMIKRSDEDCAKICALFLNRFNIHQKDGDGKTILHYAAEYGEPKTMAFLLENGAAEDVNVFSNKLLAPIHCAASPNQKSSEVMRLLLNYGAHPCAKDEADYTPLHYAVKSREKISMLLDVVWHRYDREISSSYINARNVSGRTALWCAMQERNQEVVYALLDRGADGKIPDNEGQTPFQLAKRAQMEFPRDTWRRLRR